VEIVWVALFADVAAEEFDRASAFWSGVTGATPAEPGGRSGEWVPLVRDGEDSVVLLQRTGRQPGMAGWHPDLIVADGDVAVRRARELGATVRRASGAVTVLATPAGQTFCLVEDGRARSLPRPVAWPGGHRSLVDQVCFDIPPADLDREVAFWAALTGWTHRASDQHAEFQRLMRPPAMPVQILLQRLDGDDPLRAHADLSCSDVPAEVARHEELGARVVRRTEGWTTLQDPVGLLYCVTRRVPGG
jgi:predicted enzyme related to lactoylglutathione lyase